MTRSCRGVRDLTALGIAVAGAIAIRAISTMRINFTSSLPRGIYRTVSGPPSRGAMVIVCLPLAVGRLARARRYLWNGDCPGGVAPVGKIVAAAGGDTVIARLEGLIVNGQRITNTQVLPHDSERRPLEHFPYGVRVLDRGELWLSSSHDARSFDSRYFGPIEATAVRSRIEPLWTLPPTRVASP